MDHRFVEGWVEMHRQCDRIERTLTAFMWLVSAWSMFITAIVVVFGFLRR
jgi:hypothetical protein